MLLFSSGNVAINTGTDNGTDFHVNGTTTVDGQFTNAGLTSQLIDTTSYKPIIADASGNYFRTNWYPGPFAIKYQHTIFTPTTGGTVALVNNQYNIINPA